MNKLLLGLCILLSSCTLKAQEPVQLPYAIFHLNNKENVKVYLIKGTNTNSFPCFIAIAPGTGSLYGNGTNIAMVCQNSR